MGYQPIADSKDREKWLAERRKGVGASEAAAILGLDPYKGPIAVYADKVLGEEKPDTDAMWLGRTLEPAVVERVAKEIGLDATMSGVLYRSAERPWQLATLDATLEGSLDGRLVRVPLEVKVTGGAWSDEKGAPVHHVTQVQHQLQVVDDAPCAFLGALLIARPVRFLWQRIERDDAFAQELLNPEEERFWQRVLDGRPPTVDGSPAAAEAVKRLYARDSGEEIRLGEEWIERVDELLELRRVEREVARQKEAAETRLREEIGAAARALLPDDRIVTAKTVERKAYSVGAGSYRPLKVVDPRKRGKESA
jgi:putative phage-type endonuclease